MKMHSLAEESLKLVQIFKLLFKVAQRLVYIIAPLIWLTNHLNIQGHETSSQRTKEFYLWLSGYVQEVASIYLLIVV